MRAYAQKQNRPHQSVSSSLARPHKAAMRSTHREDLNHHLQRTFGNQAVRRMLQTDVKESTTEPHLQRQCSCGNRAIAGGECSECHKKKTFGLQTKLKVHEPGDSFEQEADLVAEQVLAAPAHSASGVAPPRIHCLENRPTGQMDV